MSESKKESKKEKVQVTQIDQKTKKLLRLVKVAARLGKDRERYVIALRELNKSIPKETRAIIAKYTATLKKTIEDPSPENLRILGELALKKKIEINSWRATTREQREIVSKIAKAFYANLAETINLVKELEKELQQELELAE